VKSLATAPVRLLEQHRIGEKLEEFDPREVRRTWSDIINCAMNFRIKP
jgi:hypothetical protein